MAAETNGQHTANWSPASFRALRDALKRPGLVTLNLWPEQPELAVTLDMSGIGPLILSGKMINSVLADKERAVSVSAKSLEKEPESEEAWREITRTVLENHDYILGAVIVVPKYYMIDQLPPGGQPDDGLTVYDFTPEMRWAIIRVLNAGPEALAMFREDPVGYATTLSESTAERAALGTSVSTGDAVVAENDVQSGDLVKGTATRSGRTPKDGAKDREKSETIAVE